jgi:hypothetical protein
VTVLQSCTDPLHILSSTSSETFPTPSDCTYSVGYTEFGDGDVIEESVIALNKEADTGIKQEEIPEVTTYPDINTERDEVSYVCLCQYFCLIESSLVV